MTPFLTDIKQALVYSFNLNDYDPNSADLVKNSIKKIVAFPFNALIFAVNTMAKSVFFLITFKIEKLGVFLRQRSTILRYAVISAVGSIVGIIPLINVLFFKWINQNKRTCVINVFQNAFKMPFTFDGNSREFVYV